MEGFYNGAMKENMILRGLLVGDEVTWKAQIIHVHAQP